MNIERAFENLDFSRRGERVQVELISKPVALESGDGWRIVHLPTHPDHFYDIQWLEFTREFAARTANAWNLYVTNAAGRSVGIGRSRRKNDGKTSNAPLSVDSRRHKPRLSKT